MSIRGHFLIHSLNHILIRSLSMQDMIQKGHMSCGKDKGMMKALNLNGVRFPQWDSFTI